MDHSSLWQELAAMKISPAGAQLDFETRLAQEQGWRPAFAAAVMREYRRFLFLAATGDAPATPSRALDQAWHLHLIYSRHYWDVLCGQILHRPLHHDPATDGVEEGAWHERQYNETLARYRTCFGEAPPPAIWPQADAATPRRRRALAPVVVLAGAGLIAACARRGQGGPITFLEIIAAAGLLVGVGLVCWLLARIKLPPAGKGDGGSALGGGSCSGSHGGHGGHGCSGHGCSGSCGGGH